MPAEHWQATTLPRGGKLDWTELKKHREGGSFYVYSYDGRENGSQQTTRVYQCDSGGLCTAIDYTILIQLCFNYYFHMRNRLGSPIGETIRLGD
jgi:hypothetical protein